MKYVVDMREAANMGLDDDNLKGERRWERHVVQALLAAGRPVASSHAGWAHPTSPLWGGVTKDFSGATLIVESDPEHVRFRGTPAAFISNSFTHLTPGAEAEIRHAIAQLGRHRVALTHSFQVHVPHKRLPPDLHDLIHWLPVPAVSNVKWDHDGWSKKTLLWSGRAIHLYLMSPLKPVLDLLDWIRGIMREDHSLVFEILLGETLTDQAAADRWVWRFPEFAAIFGDLKNRVVVHTSRSWREVQAIYRRTRLCVNASMKFGGPPIEAAAHGIPVAGTANISVFHNADASAALPEFTATPAFPEFVAVDSGDTATMDYLAIGGKKLIEQLDIWHRNGVEYKHVANAYRRFVEETYTYAAFIRRLDALPVFA